MMREPLGLDLNSREFSDVVLFRRRKTIRVIQVFYCSLPAKI